MAGGQSPQLTLPDPAGSEVSGKGSFSRNHTEATRLSASLPSPT